MCTLQKNGRKEERNMRISTNSGLHSAKPDGKTRYDYTYDANGLRTSKTLYSYKNSRMEKSEITNYIWEDNVLVGYQIYFCDETEPAELNIKIIYDEYNSPVGVHYTTVGLEGDDALFDDPDMAAEDVLKRGI